MPYETVSRRRDKKHTRAGKMLAHALAEAVKRPPEARMEALAISGGSLTNLELSGFHVTLSTSG